MIRRKAQAILFNGGQLFNGHQRQVLELATKTRLPTMYWRSEWVVAGGLMSYATDNADLWHRAVVYVDKILKGAKPADLPVQQPMKFEFVINLKTAKQIGLTIAPNVLARADKEPTPTHQLPSLPFHPPSPPPPPPPPPPPFSPDQVMEENQAAMPGLN